jgi:hypothetical protein
VSGIRFNHGFVLACTALGVAAPRLGAQASDALYSRFVALSGFEARGYTFDPGIGTKSVWQWNVPIVAVVPLGTRMSVDVTTHYASGRVQTYAGATETLSGPTDTQLRILYTARRDRLVGSLSFNLPTGDRTISADEFTVAGAVGSTYLSFPVANVGTAFGVTGGLAYAQRLGTWNVGLSGSLRYLGNYAPLSNEAVSYDPGMEARVRAGVDRVLGSKSRVLLGLTVSTFSSDTYTGTSALFSGSYAPGTRFIGDFSVLRVIGRATMTLSLWDYARRAGTGSAGTNVATKDNVLNAEVHIAYPVTRRVHLEPMFGFRQWNPADYLGGRLGSGGVTLRVGLSDRLFLAASGRFDSGWIADQAAGSADLTGYGANLLLRFER